MPIPEAEEGGLSDESIEIANPHVCGCFTGPCNSTRSLDPISPRRRRINPNFTADIVVLMTFWEWQLQRPFQRAVGHCLRGGLSPW